MKPEKSDEALREKTVDALEREAGRTNSLEVFGNGIVNYVLQKAVSQLKEGKKTPLKVSLDLFIDICPPYPPVPFPDPYPELSELDICYEICGGDLQCYANCKAPSVDIVQHGRTCEDVWKDYRNATNALDKAKYFAEIVRMGCLKPERVAVVEIERAFKIIDNAIRD